MIPTSKQASLILDLLFHFILQAAPLKYPPLCLVQPDLSSLQAFVVLVSLIGLCYAGNTMGNSLPPDS